MTQIETSLLGLAISIGFVGMVYGFAWFAHWLDKRENRLR